LALGLFISNYFSTLLVVKDDFFGGLYFTYFFLPLEFKEKFKQAILGIMG